ncbi:3-carboxy-cis,cis-muconate cycloisomerase [Paracoccus sediminis]|uniref:3-carboxy-cis,cis-muconate cycloisomerase n=1 Tax=Paracoccus sediminis TaxID=1214787 RepID=A0A238WDN0_9RHOB|nr:3-carboxy-cis,cis-muconate cycloisomerase [Paracoccus sediminis]TBN50914.1 3-carboxy-cis,cis-muconate cycloisomerase [Paracoccus sediminis]SNR44527.1 3-carboxy-cis,cis-muconate cycloisomerase [Paracoccus sediminis]
MTDVFDHPWLGGLFADPDMAALWSPDAQLAGMRAFEAAFSRALGGAGAPHAEAAAQAIEAVAFDMGDLRAGTGRDGVVVPRLVRQMKAAAGDAAGTVHTGATSQDVIDTATAMAMRDTLALIDARLGTLADALQGLDTRFGARPLMGRTRMQAATEITAADRIAPWLLPLSDHRARIAQARPRIARLQLGGASGDRADLGDRADAVAADMAGALRLENPPRAWHAMRDGVAEFAGLLSLVSGTLGKMGQDIALMAQQGIGEIELSGGGASSAMAHKQNPVLAELLVTLARFNAGQLGLIHQALIHEQERSGAAWALEWMVLPQMAQATGRALTAATALVDQIRRIGSPET